MADTLEEIHEKFGDNVDPIYKEAMREPYIKSSMGYKGVILENKADNKILCNECGEWFNHLQSHLKFHHMTSRDYKDAHGLAYEIPLVTREISFKHRTNALKRGLQEIGVANLKKNGHKWWGWNKGNTMRIPISRKNRTGTCSPEQLRARMMILAKLVGKSPDIEDAKTYDKGLPQAINTMFGTWNNGKKALGFDIYLVGSRAVRYDKEELIAGMRKYVVEEGKIPSFKEYSEYSGLSFTPFERIFGSWNFAKETAGLRQLHGEVRESQSLHIIEGEIIN